jgi:hypothetical protein
VGEEIAALAVADGQAAQESAVRGRQRGGKAGAQVLDGAGIARPRLGGTMP